VVSLAGDLSIVVVAVQRSHSDLQQLYLYALGTKEWECARDLVVHRGAGVLVLDLDETVLKQYKLPDNSIDVKVRNGWGRFCQAVLRGGSEANLPHKYFRVYLCTRTTSDPQALWDSHLAPAANGRGKYPAVDRPCNIKKYEHVEGEWTLKALADVLTVHEVERHCAVVYDDKAYEKEIQSGVGNPLVHDNWHANDRDNVHPIAAFKQPYPTEKDRQNDVVLLHHAEWLKLARIKFVEALEENGRRLLSLNNLESLRNLASYMNNMVSLPACILPSRTRSAVACMAYSHRDTLVVRGSCCSSWCLVAWDTRAVGSLLCGFVFAVQNLAFHDIISPRKSCLCRSNTSLPELSVQARLRDEFSFCKQQDANLCSDKSGSTTHACFAAAVRQRHQLATSTSITCRLHSSCIEHTRILVKMRQLYF
jgi:hypothetical protein